MDLQDFAKKKKKKMQNFAKNASNLLGNKIYKMKIVSLL